MGQRQEDFRVRLPPLADRVFDQVQPKDYTQYFQEEVRDWSYMKFPFINSIGPEEGWYRVGPLARINACDLIDTPEAEGESMLKGL